MSVSPGEAYTGRSEGKKKKHITWASTWEEKKGGSVRKKKAVEEGAVKGNAEANVGYKMEHGGTIGLAEKGKKKHDVLN